MTIVPTTTLVRGARSTHTTIALKMLMAVTGVIFLGYVLLHMYGNLKAFAGHDAYNDYDFATGISGFGSIPRA